MARLALLVRLEARPGKEADVEAFLRSALQLAKEEPGTISWYALRLGPSTFGIFDTFGEESSRQAHLTGRIARALQEKAGELLARPPQIERAEVFACK